MNEGPEFYRGQRIDQALDVSADETLERWTRQPEWDTRSLEEFAADGGRPLFPPNRLEPEPGFLQWLARPEGGWLEFFRWLVSWRRPRFSSGELDAMMRSEMPALPRFVPAPPPPSTPMTTGYLRSSFPRAPLGGTGETDRRGRVIPPKPTYRPPAPPPKR